MEELEWIGDQFGSCIDPGRCDINSLDVISNGINMGETSVATVYDCSGSEIGCQLFFDEGEFGGVGYNSGYEYGSPSQFSRHIYYVGVSYPPDLVEVETHVVVSWNEGTIPYEVELVSQMVDATR